MPIISIDMKMHYFYIEKKKKKKQNSKQFFFIETICKKKNFHHEYNEAKGSNFEIYGFLDRLENIFVSRRTHTPYTPPPVNGLQNDMVSLLFHT